MTLFAGRARESGACVFIGTSITAERPGDGINRPQTFCTIISLARGFTRYTNAGVSGDTTTMMLARYEKDVLSKYPGMIAIEVGPNDEFYSIGTTQFNINVRRMVAMGQTAGARVSLIVPFLVRDVTHNTAVEAYRTVTRTIAGDTSADLFDIYAEQAALSSGTLDTLYITADPYHPTVAGHADVASRAAAIGHANAFQHF